MNENIMLSAEEKEMEDFPLKNRKRATRRKKDYAKALRKKNIYFRNFMHNMTAENFVSEHAFQRVSSIHAYSKNKIHCSCPMCAFNAKRHGRIVFRSVTMQDARNIASMDEKEKEFMSVQTI